MAADRTLAPPRRVLDRARPSTPALDTTRSTPTSASAVEAFPLIRNRDAAAIVGLLTLTIVAELPLLQGHVVAGLDSLTQFYPWYELVGATLRVDQLPGWNPYSMAGGPLAGNPLSGWTYLLATIAFTVLPFNNAVVAYQLVHVLLATLAAGSAPCLWRWGSVRLARGRQKWHPPRGPGAATLGAQGGYRWTEPSCPGRL
jgi:hypothetical protein